MPFTPSHAVVAIPFVRTRLVPAAIAIGAMTPDLPIFVPGLVPGYGRTHDLGWTPLTAMIAFILLLVWRGVLRPAVRELSPAVVASRLPRDWDATAGTVVRTTLGGGASAVGWLALSLVVGVVSHIAWDLFTHEGRTGSQLFPALQEQWGPFTGAKWMQHGSSAMGLVAIAVWSAAWLWRQAPRPVSRVLPRAIRLAWWVSLPLALVLATVGALVGAGGFGVGFTPTHLVYGVLTRVAACWGIATVVLALIVQVARFQAGRSGRRTGTRHARDVS